MKLHDLFYKFILEYDLELSAARRPNNTAENFEYKTDLYKCLKRVIYKAFYFIVIPILMLF